MFQFDPVRVGMYQVANSQTLIELLREVNWSIISNRECFYSILCRYKYWEGPLPNLLELFGQVKMEWLIMKSLRSIQTSKPDSLLDFAVRCRYKEPPQRDANGKIISERVTPLIFAMRCKYPISVIDKLFTIYDGCEVNYTDKYGNCHFSMACKYRKYEIIEKFLAIWQEQHTTYQVYRPLGIAIICGQSEIFKKLLNVEIDPNRLLTRNQRTPLHLICSRRGDLAKMAARFLATNKRLNRRVLINPRDAEGKTPLTQALNLRNWNLAKLLLMCGADPNLADVEGSGPLHYVYRRTLVEVQYKVAIQSFMQWLRTYKEVDDVNSKLTGYVNDWMIDDRLYKELIELLLAKGANPNAVDNRGWSVVHVMCLREDDDDSLPRTLLRHCNKSGRRLLIDHRDKLGCRPLHYAAQNKKLRLMEFLLRQGADPNSVNDGGYTPLHVICKREEDDELATKFFEICDDMRKTVELDAVDREFCWTPLQWAVVNILSNAVGVLVDRGADVSRVVFPTRDKLDKRFERLNCRADLRRLAHGVVKVVTCLINKGYELSPENVRSIIRTFAKYGGKLSLTANGKLEISGSWQ